MPLKNKDVPIYKDEVLDDLQLNGLKIIQNTKDYRFSSDSVLLANFVKAGHKDKVVELCSGSGVISILVNEKCSPKEITCFEIQPQLTDMAIRSVRYNNIKNIKFVNEDLINASNFVGEGQTDVVICNPPYYKVPEDESSINLKYKLTKYEFSTNLDKLFASSEKLLKYGGKMFIVHVPSRLQDILYFAQKHNLICKKLQFVYPNQTKPLSHLILAMFVKKGNEGCDVLKPIILN